MSERPSAGTAPRWRLDPVAALLAALVAVPVVAAGVRLAGAGWTPALDDGFLAVRAFDVVTGDTPLVGQYSMADGGDGPPAHSLGPMLYWLLVGPV
ncbi:MAG TPA: hypothetical protein VHK88_02615, partial [Aquihabitans sp.]|nr:hypothetical protein [Aquihabitans sp.]